MECIFFKRRFQVKRVKHISLSSIDKIKPFTIKYFIQVFTNDSKKAKRKSFGFCVGQMCQNSNFLEENVNQLLCNYNSEIKE